MKEKNDMNGKNGSNGDGHSGKAKPASNGAQVDGVAHNGTNGSGNGKVTQAIRSNGNGNGIEAISANGNGHSNGNGNGTREIHANGNGTGNGLSSRPVHLESRQEVGVFDYLIVGAGYAGSVLAERLARGSGKQVLLVDRRAHIAGNAYDHYDDSGILVHKYGPHIFHTNSREVFDYLSRFTEWRQYQHKVLASVDGQLVPIPINLDTINTLYGLNLNSFQMEEFLAQRAEAIAQVRTSEDVVVSKVGRELYEKFFRGYTRKQWGLDPSELDAQVTARVPTRTNRDDRYFTDSFQSMPRHGFTRMFGNMLDHPNIKIMLNTDYRDVKDVIPHKELIFTGPVDEFFDYQYGKLPYRCLEFKHETHNQEVYQPVAVVNYPNDNAFTRITEFKYLTGQEHAKTSIVYEYPTAEGDPYYPIPRKENADIYKQYQALAEEETGVHFVGRLATYKYYNMDQVVAQALTLYGKLCHKTRIEATNLVAESPITSVTFPLSVKPRQRRAMASRRNAQLAAS